MRELKKKQYWGSLSILAFVLTIACGYFMIYPMVNELKDMNIKVQAKTKDNIDLQNKINSIEQLNEKINNNPDKMNMLELGIPSDDAQAEIIATISSIANNAGATVKSISQSKAQSSDFTQILFVFESSYNGFNLMLNSIEQNIRYVNVKEITLTRNIKNEGQEAYIAGTMILEFYKYPDNQHVQSKQSQTEAANE